MLSLGLAAGGCVSVNGGAVELAWTLRTRDGRPVSGNACADQRIAEVQLCIQPCDDANGICSGETVCPFAAFPCDRGRGSTDFALAPGRKKLWITVTCTNGGVPDVTLPEPVLRDVTTGDVTELNALLISVPSSPTAPACGQGNGA
jgi:hypothetical protein